MWSLHPTLHPCSLPHRYGLHVSLLERLFDHEAYNSGVGQLCKTLLTENHRSHAHVSTQTSKPLAEYWTCIAYTDNGNTFKVVLQKQADM